MNDSHATLLEAREQPAETIEVKAPPDAVTPQDATGVLSMMLPLMGSMGVMVFMAVSNNNSTRMLLTCGAMVIAMLSMVVVNISRQLRQHRANVTNQRREYLAYISELRTTVREAGARQRHDAVLRLPEPEALPYLAQEGTRVWERGPGQDSSLRVRLGRTTQPLDIALQEEQLGPLAKPDPVCLSAMHRFATTHTEVDSVPFAISLSDVSHITISGPPSEVSAQARAMVAHLLSLTPPSMLRLVVLASEQRLPQWEWVKWAPHSWSDTATDAVGPRRLIATSLEHLTGALPQSLLTRAGIRPDEAPGGPHVLLLLDGVPYQAAGLVEPSGAGGLTVISLQEPPPQTVSPQRCIHLELAPLDGETGLTAMTLASPGRDPLQLQADSMSLPTAEAVARRLMGRYRASGEQAVAAPVGVSDPKRSEDLLRLLNMGDVRDLDPESHWGMRTGHDRLNVPFGVTPEGAPVLLDIKESAEGGMGPHGLLIGATGSGKSEVLRTIVLALALTHPPDQLNFVLVDFKGGATFAGMADLPHVSAMISNLEEELGLVDRMAEALRGEMTRRQQLLRNAGNYANVADYENDRRQGKHNGTPLPALFIILDEFSELLAARPEFIDTFVAIGRLGRSMQIHLLLSSQRLDEGRLRGLDSHLSYRIGLRTFSASESRTVLGTVDAYHLPSLPGVGYLKSSTEGMTQFRASYVAGRPPARSSSSTPEEAAPVDPGHTLAAPVVLPFTGAEVIDASPPAPTPPPPPPPLALEPPQPSSALAQDDRTTLDIAVARMSGRGTPAHQIWLPPLDVSETFDSLMKDLVIDPGLGLVSPSWRARGDLVVPLGVTDIPLEQRREVFSVDLSGAGGHVAVIGGPLSGKSTALRALVMGLALTRTPTEAQFYVIDLGGGTFSTLLDLPHLAGLATRDEPDIITRIVAEITALMDDRERYFRTNRVDSIQTYRRERAAGRLDDGYGDIFLIIDGWSSLKSDFEDITASIQAVAPRALALGVHFVLSSNRWLDLRTQIRDILTTRIELRLGDPIDSSINRKAAQQVPTGKPGRGLDHQARHMLIAQPRIDGNHDHALLAQGANTACQAIAKAWRGEPGPKLRLLPTRIELSELQRLEPQPSGPVIGIDEARLEPVLLDMVNDPSLIVLGDAKTGKSSFLRALAHEVCRGKTPEDVRLLAIDLRRSMLGELPEEFLLAYLTVRDMAASEINDLAGYLQGRLPGPDVTPEQLRNRSWWNGPEIYVLVDDYDLVATQLSNPLSALQPLLAQAQDIGLHLVITRRIGGASRALYEPIMQTLNDVSTPGIMLPGNPDEGPLLGRQKPTPGPPGRARLISRDAVRVIQLAWSPPTL
ncbi:type VII secretion protein EccCa [Actinomyces bowdenii]|uniref:type VII secretion protein EccCa n=1 Tax=Actinomyces bowdenii TaxID=131109 RepID=UPI00214C2554|nr:type VII secretion protein EccCa [Actinomyces bowdenii]MCR2053011.1 type VII secretion protein EccCa [Actinomyces bowdenii]